jgi:hypothetical protein
MIAAAAGGDSGPIKGIDRRVVANVSEAVALLGRQSGE